MVKPWKEPGTWYSITVYEGRNRLVRRLFEHFDLNVVKLVRYSFGEMTLLKSLAPGEYRQLSKQDIANFKKHFNNIESQANKVTIKFPLENL